MNRTLIVLWLLSGIVVLGILIGPARSAAQQNRVTELVTEANDAIAQARARQHAAALANIAAVEARRTAKRENTSAAIAIATQATAAERAAQDAAERAWGVAGAAMDEAMVSVPEQDAEVHGELRRLRNQARLGTGNVTGAVTDLETMLEELSDSSERDMAMRVRVREDLASAYYRGARLMRQVGRPESEWRLVSDRARQHARVLAEGADHASATLAKAPYHQRNLEVIMDFERRPFDQLEDMSLPDDCPGSHCRNLSLDSWPWKKKQKPSQPGDGRKSGPADAQGGS